MPQTPSSGGEATARTKGKAISHKQSPSTLFPGQDGRSVLPEPAALAWTLQQPLRPGSLASVSPSRFEV